MEKEYWMVLSEGHICSFWNSEAGAVNEAKAKALREPGKRFYMAHVTSAFCAGGVWESILAKR